MVKIITNENIRQLENKRLVESKIANHEINKEAKPVVIKRPKLRIPQRQTQSKQSKPIDKQSNPVSNQSLLNMLKSQTSREEFKEYKESLDRILINGISSLDPLPSSDFKDRLAKSKDINTILKNTILDNLNFTSYPTVLCATIASLWLESKF